MNIIFFQNCVSPHQMPYISLLPSFQEVKDVIIVVPETDMPSRKAMGWDASALLDTKGVKFLIAPSYEKIKALYEKYTDTDTWCIYSGINSFKEVTICFLLSLKYKIKRSVMTEPPLIYNHPLWQHAIRFAWKDWRYVKYIHKIFVMGDEFLPYYRFWSNRWKVIPFMYCTEWRDRIFQNCAAPNTDALKVLYVGSLSHRKNVQLLLKATQLLSVEQQKMLEIGVVGNGDELEDLKKIANSKETYSHVTFYGMQPMEKIPLFMEQYDVLCLPSLHDGWGAVVNEALTLGLYVICSDHCGAKYLITTSGNKWGRIFKSNNEQHLADILKDCIDSKDKIRIETLQRIAWAKKNISGEAVVKYFLDNLKA